jgi:hypothetical protein
MHPHDAPAVRVLNPAKRVFVGLAGSPLAQIAPEPLKNKVGRPRKYATAANKQAEYRRRVALEDELKRTNGQINGQGRLHGETLYAPQKVERIIAAKERDEELGGKKKKGRSLGTIKGERIVDSSKITTVSAGDTGELRMRRLRFPKNWTLTDQEKEKLIDQLADELFFRFTCLSPDVFVCGLCGYQCRFPANARAHLHDEYLKGVSLRSLYNSLAGDGWTCRDKRTECA